MFIESIPAQMSFTNSTHQFTQQEAISNPMVK